MLFLQNVLRCYASPPVSTYTIFAIVLMEEVKIFCSAAVLLICQLQLNKQIT